MVTSFITSGQEVAFCDELFMLAWFDLKTLVIYMA